MRGSQDSSGVAFRSFLSHRYQSPRINECFFPILSADADPQFAIDPGTIATSVTRLERLIRDADAFIGIYPFRLQTGNGVRRPSKAATASMRPAKCCRVATLGK
jgi:hypothetical protein